MARPIDRGEVDRLVVEHLPAALRFAMRLTGDVHTAEDAVQEALVRVLRQWQSYRGEASFRSWMLRIVLNVDRDRRRRRRETSPLADGDAACHDPPPIEESIATELDAAIRAAIDRLPDRQREVALLSFGEGLPADEVAQVLGISEGNVRTCLYWARKRIAEALGVDYARREST
jgi:RNA polymerase sigma-70 factor, ECF subfamily